MTRSRGGRILFKYFLSPLVMCDAADLINTLNAFQSVQIPSMRFSSTDPRHV